MDDLGLPFYEPYLQANPPPGYRAPPFACLLELSLELAADHLQYADVVHAMCGRAFRIWRHHPEVATWVTRGSTAPLVHHLALKVECLLEREPLMERNLFGLLMALEAFDVVTAVVLVQDYTTGEARAVLRADHPRAMRRMELMRDQYLGRQ